MIQRALRGKKPNPKTSGGGRSLHSDRRRISRRTEKKERRDHPNPAVAEGSSRGGDRRAAALHLPHHAALRQRVALGPDPRRPEGPFARDRRKRGAAPS